MGVVTADVTSSPNTLGQLALTMGITVLLATVLKAKLSTEDDHLAHQYQSIIPQ